MRMLRFFFSPRGLLVLVLIAALGLGLAGSGIYAMTNIWPGLGAHAIEVLRQIIGTEAAAELETLVFELQDQLKQLQYQVSGNQPQAPWEVSSAGPTAHAVPATAGHAPNPLSLPTPTPLPGETFGAHVVTPGQVTMPAQATTPEPPSWQPAPVLPNGSLQGEGQWSAYLSDEANGRVVAYRTFLQPDAARPYALVSIVAFDLEVTRLHFVLGLEEPSSPVAVRRSGSIPEADKQAGVLLAAFNGGFKTEHGHFGVGVRGVTVLPPRQGLATLAIHSNGQLQLGAWGTEITDSPDIVAWRQNCPLLVHNGEINPHTADNAPQDWGYTVKGGTATWRSALGLSADGRTLYYAVGPSLTLPVLAQSMATVGAANAMQLDINPYWTHFDAFTADGGQLQPDPLLAAMKGQADNRFLKPFSRDFFYVTLNN